MPRGRDARRPMHVQTDVADVAPDRFARMQAHPHAHRTVDKRRLGVGSGRDRIRGAQINAPTRQAAIKSALLHLLASEDAVAKPAA